MSEESSASFTDASSSAAVPRTPGPSAGAARPPRVRRVGYTWPVFLRDLGAGLTVAALDVPQAMAYALVAGIRPEYGLYTAIVVAAVATLFGSSSHLIAGPTNALSLVVFSAVAGMTSGPDDPTRIQVVVLLTLMVGLIQILIALLRLGDLTRYVSESVILGFLAGAALLIGLGQIPNLLGIHLSHFEPHNLVFQLGQILALPGSFNLRALAVGLITVAAAVSLRSLGKRWQITIPDKLIGLILASVLVWLFNWSSADGSAPAVEVIGTVPNQLPPFAAPQIQREDWIRQLSLSPLAIAVLGLVESLAIAKSIAMHTRQKLDFNRQCFAEGLANLTGSFFHCMPGCGSLTRSAINYQSGAMTRVSGIISAVAVAVVLLLFAPLASYVPKSALAAALIVTAWRLVDRHRLLYCLRATRFDAGIAVATALSALFIGIEFSILIGIFLSFMFFVPRAARLRATELVVDRDRVVRERRPDDPECSRMALLSIEGELFFGATPELDEFLAALSRRADQGARILVLRLKRARNPDMVCLEHLQRFMQEMQHRGVVVLLCGVRPDFAKALRNVHFHHWLPPDRIFLEETAAGSSTLRAVRHAYALLGQDRCPTCPREVEGDKGKPEWYYMI